MKFAFVPELTVVELEILQMIARGLSNAEAGRVVSHESTTRVADGMACRTPIEAALTLARRGAERVVMVSDDEVEAAMRALFADTHNTAEGGGAAALAALLQEKEKMRGRNVAVVLSGGNVDTTLFSRILSAD